MSATSTPIPDPVVHARLKEAAMQFVKIDDARTAVSLHVDDVVLTFPVRGTQTEAKAEWSDALWLVMKLLEKGMELK